MHRHSNYKLTLTYDGRRYFGWQKTKIGPSIEETLQNAIEIIVQRKITLQAASRTDRGVHATHQVVNFFIDTLLIPKNFQYRLNQLLPKDIRILNVEKKELSFHPSLDCMLKIYSYYIYNGPYLSPFYRNTSWHVYYPLNIEEMTKAAMKLTGYQDFSSFTNRLEKDNRRNIFDIFIKRLENTLIKIDILGDHFLYKMVRNIIGTLVHVGYGKISTSDVEIILNARERKTAPETAPACGLFLTKIFYFDNKENNDF